VRNTHFLLPNISRISSDLIVSQLISCHILTRTKWAWSFPGFNPIPVYRKARGPYRYLQHTPVIQMFPQLRSPLIAVTPVIGIVHSEHHCTYVSCSSVHSCTAWLQPCGSPGQLAIPHSWEHMCCAPCGSPGRLAIHSSECMFCALLIIVVKTSSLP
jgi:hypothetical protein